MGAVLRAADWYPGRRVDTRAWVDALRGEDYPVFQEAVRVLSEYGGLTFKPPVRPGSAYGPSLIRFVPLYERTDERPRVEDLEHQVGQRLCAVGDLADGRYSLLVAEDGHVYADGDQVLDLGATIEDALRQLIERRERARDITHELPPAPQPVEVWHPGRQPLNEWK